MKKKTSYFILSGLFVLLFFPGSQAQVSLSYTQPPPNQWKFADFWKVVITNTGNADQTIYLYGTLEESTEGKIAEATSAKFLLPKNYAGPLKTSWLQPVNQKYLNRKYEDTYRKTNTMPDGTYIICVTVYNAENKE